MPEAIIRRHLIMHGSVQGVFLRDATRQVADRHGVSGWVRNRPDGTVEAILEGPVGAVGAVEVFCNTGPNHARVDRVDASNEEPEGLSGFSVRCRGVRCRPGLGRDGGGAGGCGIRTV